jgi:YebC/PmpR family DNA-binding regulatory protein
MSGHSKWSTIKHKKGAADAKRSKIFTKILKEITVASRIGGGDLGTNPRLRTAVEKGRSNNLPKDTIERAIKKGTGDLEGVNYEEVVYEGYGPGGAALIISTLTDNLNRTVAEVRYLLNKYGGNLGKTGAVSWKFDKVGVILIPKSSTDEDTLMELALDVGAEDIKSDDDEYFEVTTQPNDVIKISESLKEKGMEIESSEVMMIPQTFTTLTGKQAVSAWRLVGLIEENDDVQDVWHDIHIDDEELKDIAGK